jgi:heme exporter protein A
MSRTLHLEARGLGFHYGRLAVLRDLDLEVVGGELLLVTGKNGSGKSTLLRCLAGLTVAQRGEIHCTVEGRPLGIAERRRAVGYAAPDLELYGELTTSENLAFACRLRGLGEGRGDDLLRRLGLPLDRDASALSSGMRQRLRWAWALLHRPAILLLDEPLQNLDNPGRRDVLELLDEHLAQGGLAVVANPEPLELHHVARHLDLGG